MRGNSLILILSIISILSVVACTTPAPEQQVCLPSNAVVSGQAASGNANVAIIPVNEVTPNEDQVVTSKPVTDTKPAVNPAPYGKIYMDDNTPAIQVVEGQLVNFNLKAADPDGDKITYTYSSPLDSTGKWQTQVSDQGTYFSTITASDGKTSTSQRIKIIVQFANRPPVIENLADVVVNEGETVTLNPAATDADNDKVAFSYSGWMNSNAYKTNYNDAGEHVVKIIAADGINVVSKDVKVIVNNVNRPPVLGEIPDVVAKEGDLVKLDYFAFDPDKDKLSYSFSKPFNDRGEWLTGNNDAGDYPVTITASDGQLTDTKAFKVTILNINRPPVIKGVGSITVKEGDTISYHPVVSDTDGDAVSIFYSGWMNSSTYTTGFDDQGNHVVHVTATDGTNSVTVDSTVTVINVDRPPVFQLPQ